MNLTNPQDQNFQFWSIVDCVNLFSDRDKFAPFSKNPDRYSVFNFNIWSIQTIVDGVLFQVVYFNND